MGSRGPQPTPTKMLEARGSWRAKVRQNAGEIEPLPLNNAPKPPKFLGKFGKAEWKRACRILMELNALNELSLTALAMLVCKPIDDYWKADALVEQHGILIEGREGKLVKNPASVAKATAWAQYNAGCAKFGLTLADKTKITSNGKTEVNVPPPRVATQRPAAQAATGTDGSGGTDGGTANIQIRDYQ